jgi:hypothetical protein
MPDLFEPEVSTMHVACSECGTPLELATSALSVFGSGDAVLCMDCLLRQGSEASSEGVVPLAERIKLIDETVEEFAAHLRNVLVRCIKPDLTWNREYGVDDWSDSGDVVAASYAPGIWYAVRRYSQRRASLSGEY